MTVYNRLTALYHSEGYRIVSGIDSAFSKSSLAEYTWLYKDKRPVSQYLGISLKELYFFECLFEDYHPSRIFAIGNSFGWSSLALSILNPQSQTIVIEAGADSFTHEWIYKTNTIARAHNLTLKVIQALSPRDISDTIHAHFSDPVDFFFIDGDHSELIVRGEFISCLRCAHQSSVFAFHDAWPFELLKMLVDIARAADRDVSLLLGTTSGLALAYGRSLPRGIIQVISEFGGTQAAMALANYLYNHTKAAGNMDISMVAEIIDHFST